MIIFASAKQADPESRKYHEMQNHSKLKRTLYACTAAARVMHVVGSAKKTEGG
jgi:hypothetical protein